MVENWPANARDLGLTPRSGRSPREGNGRKWQPTPVFLPGKSHVQRSLSGYSPWVTKEFYMTEQLNNNKSVPYLCQ